jgi:hypothetical protein
MNATIARRLTLCGLLTVLLPGCGGGDPTPHRVAVQEPAKAPAAGYAEESSDGITLLGAGVMEDRLLPRQRSAEQTTLDALARIGTPSVSALVAVLHDADPELRRAAALSLARIGPDASEAVPDLIAALDDKDAGVRKFATRALGEIGPAAGKAVPALIQELRQNAKATEQAAKAAAAAAAKERASDSGPPTR